MDSEPTCHFAPPAAPQIGCLWRKRNLTQSRCPTTSRHSVIPAGNIREQQPDLSPGILLGRSLRGCGAAVSEELRQADYDTLICLVGRHLERQSGEKMNTRPPPQCSLKAVQIRRPPCGGIRVAFVNQSPSEEKSLHEVSSRTERSTWSRHPIRLLFLPGITE